MKGNMQGKTKKKKETKPQDLKPAKDPKGGAPPGPCRPGRGDIPAVQKPAGSN
jgi:hypothetical protein